MKKLLPTPRKLSGIVIIVNTFMPLILIAAIAWLAVDLKNQICNKAIITIKLINKKSEISDCGLGNLFNEIKAPLTDELNKVNDQINSLNNKIEKFNRSLSKKKSEIKESFQELAPQIKAGKFLAETRKMVNKELLKVPISAYQVIDKIANPEARNSYKAIVRLNNKWDKINKNLIKPSKKIYDDWKSNLEIILLIAGIWVAITYLVWCYRRISLGISLILDKSV